ncbi:MAG: tRNA-dihydrouridine synthase family protein [Fibrobacter sp.]|nr:tRNA-dihydrouridine synthase family protein [Fibrobacter sp.]
MLPIFLAPLQGYTDAIYRQNHAKFAGGIKKYYSPFVRVEKGVARDRDLWDVAPENNKGYNLVPQIIFSGLDEFDILVNALVKQGYREIDLNMGCPYPMQTGHGRGSGILPHPEIVAQVAKHINTLSEIQFSIKMRLGLKSAEECEQLLPILNDTPLTHITMHPRLGIQQYKGALDMESFQRFYEECRHPVIFNGDVLSVRRIRELEEKYPKLAGVMIGRGILTIPTMAAEYECGTSWTVAERNKVVWDMHQGILEQSKMVQLDQNQTLNRFRCFWEYQTETLPPKLLKQVAKCKSFANYESLIPDLATFFK